MELGVVWVYVMGQAGTLTQSYAGDDRAMGHPQVDIVVSKTHAEIP